MSSKSDRYTEEKNEYFRKIAKSRSTTEHFGMFRKLAVNDDGGKRSGMFAWFKGKRWHERFFYLNACANKNLFRLYDSSIHGVFDDVDDEFCEEESKRVIAKLSALGSEGLVQLIWCSMSDTVSQFVTASARFLVTYQGTIVDKVSDASLQGRDDYVTGTSSKIEDMYTIWCDVLKAYVLNREFLCLITRNSRLPFDLIISNYQPDFFFPLPPISYPGLVPQTSTRSPKKES